MGLYQFLYLPNSPKYLLGRDLFENLEATIPFRKRKIKFKIPEDKLILALGLTIDKRPTNNNDYLEQISNQVYPRVWNTDIPGKYK